MCVCVYMFEPVRGGGQVRTCTGGVCRFGTMSKNDDFFALAVMAAKMFADRVGLPSANHTAAALAADNS